MRKMIIALAALASVAAAGVGTAEARSAYYKPYQGAQKDEQGGQYGMMRGHHYGYDRYHRPMGYYHHSSRYHHHRSGANMR